VKEGSLVAIKARSLEEEEEKKEKEKRTHRLTTIPM